MDTLIRAKHKNWKELHKEKWWVTGNLVVSEDSCEEYKAIIIPKINSNMFVDSNENDLGFENWYLVEPETICHYTGLTDKNDEKIFEGDICEFSVFDYNGHDTQYKGVIVYDGSRFMLWKSKDSEYYGDDGGFDLDWTVAQDDEFEVIGNIFDNPELVEEINYDA